MGSFLVVPPVQTNGTRTFQKHPKSDPNIETLQLELRARVGFGCTHYSCMSARSNPKYDFGKLSAIGRQTELQIRISRS